MIFFLTGCVWTQPVAFYLRVCIAVLYFYHALKDAISFLH